MARARPHLLLTGLAITVGCTDLIPPEAWTGTTERSREAILRCFEKRGPISDLKSISSRGGAEPHGTAVYRTAGGLMVEFSELDEGATSVVVRQKSPVSNADIRALEFCMNPWKETEAAASDRAG